MANTSGERSFPLCTHRRVTHTAANNGCAVGGADTAHQHAVLIANARAREAHPGFVTIMSPDNAHIHQLHFAHQLHRIHIGVASSLREALSSACGVGSFSTSSHAAQPPVQRSQPPGNTGQHWQESAVSGVERKPVHAGCGFQVRPSTLNCG